MVHQYGSLTFFSYNNLLRDPKKINQMVSLWVAGTMVKHSINLDEHCRQVFEEMGETFSSYSESVASLNIDA